MFTLREEPEHFHKLNAKCKSFLQELAQEIPANQRDIHFDPQTHLFQNDSSKNCIYFLTDGMLTYSENGRVLFYLDRGDLLGLENPFISPEAEIVCEAPITVNEYVADEFFQKIHVNNHLNDVWDNYVACRSSLFTIMLSTLIDENAESAPDIKEFKKGSIIIEQGATAQEAYTMIEGKADVMVNGVKVGEIKNDEIFGAMAVLAHLPRSASVIATTDCSVFALNGKDFVKLIHNRPATVLKMIEDLAHAINQLNSKVVTHQKDPLFAALQRSLR